MVHLLLNEQIIQMENRRDKIILDGRIKLITELSEFRMSLWINGFGLNNALTGEEIIPLISFFNLENIEENENILKIKFRIYPNGSKDYEVEINPFSKTFKYQNKEYHTNDFYKTFTGNEYE